MANLYKIYMCVYKTLKWHYNTKYSCNVYNNNNNICTQNEIASRLDLLWKFVKPISFSLIGKEVDFQKLDGKVVGYGLVVLFVGCMVSCFLNNFFFR